MFPIIGLAIAALFAINAHGVEIEVLPARFVPHLKPPKDNDEKKPNFNELWPDNKYPLNQAFDENLETTWVANNERAAISFSKQYAINRIELVNGYSKSSKAWLENAVASKVRYRTCCNLPQQWNPWIEAVLPAPRELPPKDRLFQAIRLANPGPISQIEIEITDSIKPSPLAKDICVSEIRFFANEEPKNGHVCKSGFDTEWKPDFNRNKEFHGEPGPGETFDWIDFDKCAFLVDYGTGNYKFQGKCEKKGNKIHFNGEKIIHEAMPNIMPTSEKFSKAFPFKQIDRYTVLFNGDIFTREATTKCERAR